LTTSKRFRFDWLKQVTTAPIPAPQFHTLVALWNHADENCNARPGIETLAEECRCSGRTIERHLQWARDNGWISPVWRGRGSYASIYTLTLPSANPTPCVSAKTADAGKSNPTHLSETPASNPTPRVSPQQREHDRQSSLTTTDVLTTSLGAGVDSKVEDRPVDESVGLGIGSLRSRLSNLHDDAPLDSTGTPDVPPAADRWPPGHDVSKCRECGADIHRDNDEYAFDGYVKWHTTCPT
jgi:hypothetical protein